MTGHDKVEVENINTHGRATRRNRAKYEAIKDALLLVLPADAPGKTVKDALTALKAKLPEKLYPSGATSGWWQKSVQLDLEAKGVLRRSDTKPLHLHRTGK